MIILDNNRVLALTSSALTASSANTYLPAANVLDPVASKSWRTTSGTSHTLILDFGSALTFTSAAVLLQSSTAISSVVVEFGSDGVIWSDSQTIITGAPIKEVGVKKFSTITKRYAKLTITLASSGTSDLYALHLGTYYAPTHIELLGHEVTYIDRSTQSVNGDGYLFTNILPEYTVVKYALGYNLEAERLLWLNQVRSYSKKQAVFLVLDYDEPGFPNYVGNGQTMTFYGKFPRTGKNKSVRGKNLGYVWKSEGWEFIGINEQGSKL